MYFRMFSGHIRALQWLILEGFSVLTTDYLETNMPLHTALSFLPWCCPLTVAIAKLREMMPLLWSAICCRNRRGYLPIHIACALLQNNRNVDFYTSAIDLMTSNTTGIQKYKCKILFEKKRVYFNVFREFLSRTQFQLGTSAVLTVI